MGYEIAKEAIKRHYKVTLITGPTSIEPPLKAKIIRIETAKEMEGAVLREIKKADCLIMAAAVSDFRVKATRRHKIKKEKTLMLKLVKNKDILKSISRCKLKAKVGFALESNNLFKNARQKLIKKDLDLIIANKVDKQNAPFGKGKKDFILVKRKGNPLYLRNKTKREVSCAILDILKKSML